MGTMNKAILIGNLGRDCELRYTPGGAAVATFNIATTETWKDNEGQKKEQTDWHRIVLWGKQAESLQEYLKKGKQVAVEGSIHTRKWQDKDGNDKYTTEIKAHRVTLLGGNGGGRRVPHPADTAQDAAGAQPERNDDAGSQLDTRSELAGATELSEDDIPF